MEAVSVAAAGVCCLVAACSVDSARESDRTGERASGELSDAVGSNSLVRVQSACA